MPDLTTDRLVQILLGLAAAGGISWGGMGQSGALECAEQLDAWQRQVEDVRADAQAREIRDSNACHDLIAATCGDEIRSRRGR